MASSQELLLGTGTAVNQYQIQRSLRFNSADSAYLNRTPASTTNRKTWTWSAWIKLGTGFDTRRMLFGGGAAFVAQTQPNTYIEITDGNVLGIDQVTATTGTLTIRVRTSAVLRDPSAWYHVVIAVDTTQGTDTNRVKMYINGVQQTSFSSTTYPSLNLDTGVNTTTSHKLGSYVELSAATLYFDGYMTEINFIDGQQLTSSSFGQTNSATGVWEPKAYSGSYGTNGFYLNFSDNSSNTDTTLGKDYSGNGNNWTPNNFAYTGAGTDSMVDTPTPYGTDTGVGGEVRGNYCTLNPLQTAQSASAPNNGNLTSPANPGVWRRLGTTMQLPTTGKWYFEYNCDSFGTFNTFSIGVFSGSMPTTNDQIGFSATEWGYDAQTGQACARNNNSTITSGFSNATSGDVLQLAYDAATGSIWFGKNNTWQGASSPNPATGTSPTYTGVYNVTPVMVQNWATQSVNFGQRPFAYTAPSGFKALCTQNLPTPTIGATSATQAGKYFNTVLYTGTGSSLGVTGVGFQPDWTWIKSRSAATDHGLYDAVRGVQKQLESNNTDIETTETTGLTAFNSDGFTVGALAQLNTSSATYASWNWNAGGSNQTISVSQYSSNVPSIASTVRANTTAGFSIVAFTTSGSHSTATIGHGLGVAPSMIILKNRNGVPINWNTYHISLGNTQAVYLQSTSAAITSSAFWNDTSPTSTVFTVGNNLYPGINHIAYCFAPIAGYSAFGSYTGNGADDGPFNYLGFRAAWILVKRSSSSGEGWWIYDNKRSPYNIANVILSPDSSGAEISGGTYPIDINSNGFKIRGLNALLNTNGATYIYAAFAENPFKYSLAR